MAQATLPTTGSTFSDPADFPKLTYDSALKAQWRMLAKGALDVMDKTFFRKCAPYLKVVMAHIQQAQMDDSDFDPGLWPNLPGLSDLPKSVSEHAYRK